MLIGVLPFIERPVVRAGVGCALASLSCVSFREMIPFQRKSSNTLQLFCLYQTMLTYAGAFLVLTKPYDMFNISDELLGAGLVVVNVTVIPLLVGQTAASLKENSDNEKTVAKFRSSSS